MSIKVNDIGSLEELDEIFERSNVAPVLIFKHSNTCGISADVLQQLSTIDGEMNMVVVQERRAISDAIADRTVYRHQSPQAFVIDDGKVVYHASHYGIDPERIAELLSN